MVSNRCKMAVKDELKKLGLHFIVVDLGEVEIMETITPDQREKLKLALINSGLELMDDKRAVLIEKIKNTIIEMVHHSDEMIKTNFFKQNRCILFNTTIKYLRFDFFFYPSIV